MSHLELVQELLFRDLPLQNISVTEQEILKEKTYFSSWIISSVSHRQVQRFRLFWDVCHQLWVTNLHWLPRWEQCKSVLLQQKRDPVHQHRRFPYLQKTGPTLNRLLPLPTLMQQRYYLVKLQNMEFILLLNH